MKRVLSCFLTVLILAAVLSACSAPTAKLALDKTELTMTVGDTIQLSAGDAARVNWTSANDKIASVSAGTVSAKSAGTTVITASLESGEKATCNVTVNDKLITAITLNASSTRIEPGKTIQLTASYTPSDASDTELSWASEDENIAMVNSLGYVTAIGEGVTSVTCTSTNGIKAACTVTVGGLSIPTTPSATLPPATEKPAETTAEAQKPRSQPDEDEDDDDDEIIYTPLSYTDGCVFPDSSVRYLSASEVAATLDSMTGSPVSSVFAQDAVNEIFARHGYVFSTPSIRAYYMSQPWYRPDPSYDGSVTEIEEYNIELFFEYYY